MKLVTWVEDIECRLNELITSLAFCFESFVVCIKTGWDLYLRQNEQMYIDSIDENLTQAFKKLIAVDSQLEKTWTMFVIHKNPAQLKNMLDNEHIFNRLKSEFKNFMVHYTEYRNGYLNDELQNLREEALGVSESIKPKK